MFQLWIYYRTRKLGLYGEATSVGYMKSFQLQFQNNDNILISFSITDCLNSDFFGVVILIILLILFLALGLYHVRRYNRSFTYGTGGCRATLLWTSFDCPVLV